MPAGNVLGEEGRGVNVLMSGLDYERAVLAGGPLGIMAACLDVAVPYVRERKQFGTRIADFQALRFRMADYATEIEAARLMLWRAALGTRPIGARLGGAGNDRPSRLADATIPAESVLVRAPGC